MGKPRIKKKLAERQRQLKRELGRMMASDRSKLLRDMKAPKVFVTLLTRPKLLSALVTVEGDDKLTYTTQVPIEVFVSRELAVQYCTDRGIEDGELIDFEVVVRRVPAAAQSEAA